MNAIEMLTQEHRAVDGLFDEFERQGSASAKRQVFDKIADALALHAAIEERHFYPSVKDKGEVDLVLQALEEHLEVKRMIADLLSLEAGDDSFDEKVSVLKDDVQRHVAEEERELFPEVQRMFDEEELEVLGAAMEQTEGELLEAGSPRNEIPSQTESAPGI